MVQGQTDFGLEFQANEQGPQDQVGGGVEREPAGHLAGRGEGRGRVRVQGLGQHAHYD